MWMQNKVVPSILLVVYTGVHYKLKENRHRRLSVKEKKIITVANSKGGPGKTTIATNLAVEFSHDGHRVLLVDADVQGSSLKFRKVRKKRQVEVKQEINAMAFIEPTLDLDLPSFNYDYIIVDVGGADSEVFRSAILAADLVLIPTRPSQYDIWEAKETIETLEKCRMKKDIPARLVLNQVIPNTNISSSSREALKHFAAKAELARTQLGLRVAFEESVNFGEGVSEFEPGGKAVKELQGLYCEVLDILEGGA